MKVKDFIHDDDGFSARDFIMVAFCGAYLLFLTVAYIMAIFHKMPGELLEIIQSMSGVVMTIVGGVFAVQTAQTFTNRFVGGADQVVTQPVDEGSNDHKV